jgi:hypothetical protein
MAKRFTDTDKWKKGFIKSLPASYKLLWLYIIDDCDHAGIWHVDLEVACLRIGEDVTEEQAQQFFGENIKSFDGGEKWFIPSFIEFQYGQLNEKNRVHEAVLKILSRYNLLEIKPLTSPLQGAKEKDKDKEMDKEMDKDKGGVGENSNVKTLLVPQMAAAFKKINPHYPADISRDYPALRQAANFLAEHNKSGPPMTAEGMAAVIPLWEKVCNYISKDKFFKNYSITQVEKHLQSIVLNIQNGTNTNSKTGGGVTGYELEQAHAKYFN